MSFHTWKFAVEIQGSFFPSRQMTVTVDHITRSLNSLDRTGREVTLEGFTRFYPLFLFTRFPPHFSPRF